MKDNSNDIKIVDWVTLVLCVMFGTFAVFAVCSGYTQHIYALVITVTLGTFVGRELYKIYRRERDKSIKN